MAYPGPSLMEDKAFPVALEFGRRVPLRLVLDECCGRLIRRVVLPSLGPASMTRRRSSAAADAPVDRDARAEQSGEILTVAPDQIKLSDRDVGYGLEGPLLDRTRIGLAAL